MGFGPYDNGYLLLGLKSGTLLILDTITLDKLCQLNLTRLLGIPLTSITSFSFDPTNHLFVLFKSGDTVCLSLDQKRYNYLYLEVPNETGEHLNEKIYCTTI